MRFEIRETVPTPDREMVLRALEMCSREISSEVVRLGDRITVHGLGPSPRAKNRNDMTVFCVNAEQDKTVIEAEVNFQASALLGETSQQDVVRSKLDDLFGQMNAQISLDTLRMSTYTAARRSASSATAVVERPYLSPEATQQPLEEISPEAHQTLPEASDAAPEPGGSAAALGGEPELKTTPEESAEPPKVVRLEDEALSAHLLPPAVANAPYRTFAAVETKKLVDRRKSASADQAFRPRSVSGPAAPELTWVARSKSSEAEEDVEETNSRLSRPGMWAAALIAFLLVAGGIDYSYLSRRNAAALSAPVAAPSGSEAATTPPAVVNQEAAAVSSSAKKSNPQSATVDPATSAASAANLRLWLQSWSSAMSTRDANAQVAFYANTVDRYLDQRKVGKDAVLRDREATIRMKKGLWTVKMEDIVVERQSESEAQVRLVKHFIDEPERSEILESFVPTRLIVKRFDGAWKITSEQDLPTLVVTPLKTSRRFDARR